MNKEAECTLSNIGQMSQGSLIQRDIVDAGYVAVQPTIKNSSIVEFHIDSGDNFIDLNKSELEVKFRIKKADGTNLAEGEKVAMINYPIATIFSSIQVTLNDKTITHGDSNYAERAIMETLLTYGIDASKNWLQAGLFYKDTAGKMDSGDPTQENGNLGLKQRAEFTSKSKLATVRGKLHLDIFNQPKPLINNSRLHVKLTQNKDAYVLMSGEADPHYKVEIKDIILWVRKLIVSDQVQKSIIGRSVIMPLTRAIQREFTITPGGRTFVENNLHNGQLPTKLIMGLVRNDAHVGSYKHNPLNFQHFDVSKVSLFLNGQIVDGRPLSFDFGNDDYIDGFWGLSRAANHRYFNDGTLITRKDYKSGYTLWSYDLTPSQCDEQFNDPKKRGTLTAEFEFAKNIPTPLTLCVYFQFDSEIIINEGGSVVTLFE